MFITDNIIYLIFIPSYILKKFESVFSLHLFQNKIKRPDTYIYHDFTNACD